MYKENLFELIRAEQLAIWAGAGMSMYAGYPSGNQFAEILIGNLTDQEKKSINTNLPLPDLAEEFYRIKGNNRNRLIQILNKTFLKKSKSCETHDSLALIPHIKTIITTNYDTLFEDSYGQKAQINYSATHIPYIDNRKTQIFKVHGDLNAPDSVIITKSDYNTFFKANEDNGTFWSVIRERLATNAVCFIGYNLEDPNVSVVFDRITDSLGENRKEVFLIAPNLSRHKISNLNSKGVHYIDSTAEVIVQELLLHLKEHIISDLESGKTSTDTFKAFLENMGLLPDLKASLGNFSVASIKGTNANTVGTANFTFKNESEFISKFEEFTQGKTFGTFKVPEDKLLKSDIRYGGVKFPNPKGIAKLEFRSCPSLLTKVDIRFIDGFEIGNMPVIIYVSKFLIEIHLEFDSAILILKLNLTKDQGVGVNFHYDHKELCSSIKNEIAFYSFLKRLAEGTQFTVYPESGESINEVFPKSRELLENSQLFLSYFKNLQRIENVYDVRFSNFPISEISELSSENVEYIISVIENDYIISNWDGEIEMTLIDNYDDELIEQFESLNSKKVPLQVQETILKTILLHGEEIKLGYRKVELQQAVAINFADVLNRNENVLRIKSYNKVIHVSYSQERPD